MKTFTEDLEKQIRAVVEQSLKSKLERFITSVKSSMAAGHYDWVDLDNWDWVVEFEEYLAD